MKAKEGIAKVVNGKRLDNTGLRDPKLSLAYSQMEDQAAAFLVQSGTYSFESR